MHVCLVLVAATCADAGGVTRMHCLVSAPRLGFCLVDDDSVLELARCMEDNHCLRQLRYPPRQRTCTRISCRTAAVTFPVRCCCCRCGACAYAYRLADNHIGDEGATALAEMLRVNDTLQLLE